MDWGWKGEGTIPSSLGRLKIVFWRSKIFPMGRCDPGDQILLKIQSARNHFKSNGNVGLVITNPTQLIWVQMDIERERYCVMFKMTNRQKKGMLIVQSVRTLTWQVVWHVAGSYLESWHVTWLVCSERVGDTWPNQWPPCVTCLFVKILALGRSRPRDLRAG